MKSPDDQVTYPDRFELQPYITTEVMIDEIDDELYFNSYAEGDTDDENHKDPVIYKLGRFPAGTQIIVMVPTCNGCGLFPDECDCETEEDD